jgi:PKD repeat protein/glucose/arabinose dehydrogenase
LAVLLLAAVPPPLRLNRLPAGARPATVALPAGFVDDLAVADLPVVTAVAWAADGRLFLAEKDGRVRIVQAGGLLPDAFIDISAQVNTFSDRGLNGLALHPDFPATPYVYLWFTYDPPDLPGTNLNDSPDGGGARVSRLVRVSADPDHPNQALPGSEVVLLGHNSTLANIGAVSVSGDALNPYPPPSCGAAPAYVPDCVPTDTTSHSVGTVMFGPDGALYAGHGDGAHFMEVDPRALRALDVDSLAGKILRIDPLTGNGYPDNPYFDGDVTSNRSRVWAYGLRNPFRFSFQPGTGQIVIGDVGWNSWEEIDVGGGRNFGWPCYEGAGQQPLYAIRPATTAACQALYALGPAAVSPPVYQTSHFNASGSIIGGVYAVDSPYPSAYAGAYFFADFSQNRLYVLHPGPGDDVSVELFAQLPSEAYAGPVQLLRGPDGNIYYLRLGWQGSTLHRLRYVAGDNAPPVAHLAAAPTNGSLPLEVTFSAAGSADPDAQSLTYAWDYGDGDSASGVSPVHTYTVAGIYPALLTVTDSLGLTATAQIAISAGNHAPVASILTPLTGTLVSAGQVISFTGAAEDVEDGSLTGAQLQWALLLHHYDHVHPDALPPSSGAGGSFLALDHGDNTWLELCLTATDTGGLHATDCRPLWPSAGLVQLRTVPAGLQLLYAGAARSAPHDTAVQVDAVREVQAPAVQAGLTFTGWDDGAAPAARVISGILATQIFTATYTNTAPVAVAAAGPLTGVAPLPVAFSATESYDPDGASVTYFWDFGDGASAATGQPAHVYPRTGVFTATLTVTDPWGLTDQAQLVIHSQARLWLPIISR